MKNDFFTEIIIGHKFEQQYGFLKNSEEFIDSCMKLLFVFAGPPREGDSFEHYVEQLRGTAECLDTLRDKLGHDILSERSFENLLERIASREFDAELWSPPCGTFSMVREVLSKMVNRPRPLRLASGPELLGRKDLSVQEKLKVAQAKSKQTYIH